MSKLVLRNVKDVIVISLVNVLIVGIIYFLFKFNGITYYKYGLYAISGLYFIGFLFAITSGVGRHYTGCSAVGALPNNNNNNNNGVGHKSFNGISKYKLYNFEIRMISIFIVTALIGILL